MDLIEYFMNKKIYDKEILKKYGDIFTNNMIKWSLIDSYNFQDAIKESDNEFELYLKNKYGNITGKVIYISLKSR